MIFPESFEEKIAFPQIRAEIQGLCQSASGTELAGRMGPLRDYHRALSYLQQADEAAQLLQSGHSLIAYSFPDIRALLPTLRLSGATLAPDELLRLKQFLTAYHYSLHLIRRQAQQPLPQLQKLCQNLLNFQDLEEQTDLVVDEEGNIWDSASRELYQLRQQIRQQERSIRSQLDHRLRALRDNNQTPDDMTLTVRGGRLVIPVFAEYKREVPGLIHDESASGQVAYLEPQEAVEGNNALRELQYREQREVARILRETTAAFYPHVQDLERSFRFLTTLDFITAKARWARKYDAITPHTSPKPALDWRNARHPLLQKHLRDEGKELVPVSLKLDRENRVLIISGPNAGGKSVVLKTVSLLQYLFQCGLPLPMESGSTVGWFSHLFLDIGDEQSIENDLSTYSSHLGKMKHFLKLADRQTLFLIDEFGSGTDPSLGGAIAQAILEQLLRSKAFGLVTTHYQSLKDLGEETPGALNAAMAYDLKNLQPLFRLQVGEPGSSFALEIARKMGLPENILERTKQLAGEEKVEAEYLLNKIRQQEQELNEKETHLHQEKAKFEKAAKDYQELKQSLKNREQRTLRNAEKEAKALIEEANQRIEGTIREIRESQADKATTQKARNRLNAWKQENTEAQPETAQPSTTASEQQPRPLRPGDWVQISGSNTQGEVLKISEKEAEVAVGSMTTHVKPQRLERIKKPKTEASAWGQKPSYSSADESLEKQQAFHTEIDVRGQRGDQALQQVNDLLDDALIAGAAEIRIVHGKGEGILRRLIRDELQRMPQVAALHDEHPDRGGHGVTIAELK